MDDETKRPEPAADAAVEALEAESIPVMPPAPPPDMPKPASRQTVMIAAISDPAAVAAPATPDSAQTLRDVVQGGTLPVAVSTIDRELMQFWKSTTSGGDNEGKVAVTLMRAMNLIVYVEDDTRAEVADDAVSRIIGRHPCRTIMIANRSGTPTAPPSPAPAAPVVQGELEAVLSAHCQLTDASGKQICCEQISIYANSPPAVSRVSNVALNLLITDLPVFLWWAGGAPFNNQVLTHLEDSIDRLMVDSAQFADPMAGLLALSRVVDPAFRAVDAARYAPSDFNWDRLQDWREATAQIFDLPEYLPSLGRIGTVEIQYAAPAEGAPPNPVAAFLYAGWLATRLGWEFHTTAPPSGRGQRSDFVVTLRQGVRSIPIMLRAVDGGPAAPGGLLSVRLTTNEANPLTFQIGQTGDSIFLDCRVERDGAEPLDRKARLTVADEITLLDTAMELFGHDAIYEESLIMAGGMAWASMSLTRRAEISAQLGTEQRHGSFDPRF